MSPGSPVAVSENRGVTHARDEVVAQGLSDWYEWAGVSFHYEADIFCEHNDNCVGQLGELFYL
jgi:hypothetical protein